MVDCIIRTFDIWTDAQGMKSNGRVKGIENISLEGIAHLRELILELAIRGKLVSQAPTDEPASKLLENIASERSRLIKEKKIKEETIFPILKQTPYKLPPTWQWCYLNDLGVISSSSRVHQKDWQTQGIPFYRAREIVKLSRFGYVDNDLFISKELYNRHKEKGIVPEENDIMITGVGTIGVPYVVKKNDLFYFKDASVLIFKNHFKLYPEYLNIFFNSKFWEKVIHKDSMGTTVDTLTIARAKAIPIALPPLDEQKRIVAKVDELMGLCDKLEKEQTSNLKTHQVLTKSLLDTLVQATDANELQAAWQEMWPHFDFLFCTDESIDQLKHSILQLAIRGRLIKQRPDDEPASELLEVIKAEKEKLINKGKLKKEKELPPIKQVELPFKLQNGWAWTRLADIAYVGNGSTPDKKEFTDVITDVPYLKVYNIVNQKVDFHYKPQYIRKACHQGQLKRSICYSGDVLMNIVGPPLGKIAIVPYDIPECNINQAIVVIRPFVKELNNWIYWYLCEQSAIKSIVTKGTAGQDNISVTQSRNLIIPIPPFNEQKRIIAKVEELLEICNILKNKINGVEEVKLNLSKTIIESALT